jgi:eukaryotic-like serine/threonine-protein kinase
MNWLSDEAISRLQAANATPDLAGTRYRLIECVGSGGMGVVYLAEDSVLGRRVALKVLDLPDAPGELAARLVREAHILASLEHPGIVPVHDAGVLPDGRAFYAMKFVEGQRLDRLSEKENTMSARLRIFQRICDTVAFAHARGVLHRDLKPPNIMVGFFGEILVMDWGVAKILGRIHSSGREPVAVESLAPANDPRLASPAKNVHGAIIGTAGYMAPEQARGDIEALDERSDIFSLGAILQFLLANPARQSPRPVAAIARKAMAANPCDRYTSASALGKDIACYLDGLPVSAYPENIFRKVARWASRHRVAIALVLTYLVVRAALIFWARH